MRKSPKFSPKFADRAVRMVCDAKDKHRPNVDVVCGCSALEPVAGAPSG
jgi:hypothetical protein